MGKMDRGDFQEISRIRRREAASLLKAKHYAGAYYLIGYAVECALKACIAKQTMRYDFPPKKNIVDKYYSHDLENLINQAGLKLDLDENTNKYRKFHLNWSTVKDWKEQSRYRTDISRAEAEELYFACTSRKNGILSWIKTKW